MKGLQIFHCNVDPLQTTAYCARGDFLALTVIDQRTEFVQCRIRLSGEELSEFQQARFVQFDESEFFLAI